MANAQSLSEAIVKTLPAPPSGNKVHFFAGAVVQGQRAPKGFGVRVTANGARAYVLNYRLGGREHRYTIGVSPDWPLVRAIREARELRQRVDRGDNPLDARKAAEPEPEVNRGPTVNGVLDAFVERHVKRNLRRPDNYTRAFDRLVRPAIGDLPIAELKRRHIVEMLDQIEDSSRRQLSTGQRTTGKTMADRVKSYVMSALNWHAERDDEFEPPNVKRTRRDRSTGRDRVLSDDELRLMVPAFDDAGQIGAVAKFLLLTAQRRSDVTGMRWGEVQGDVWTIPADRYKTGEPHMVPLSTPALAVLQAHPQGQPGDLVFPGRRRDKPVSDGGAAKAKLDKAIAKHNGGEPIPPWVIHDLRRTARTLLSRAGVGFEVAERVLGHATGNRVSCVYDRHSFMVEKRDALERLARMIERNLVPPDGKVFTLGERRQGAR